MNSGMGGAMGPMFRDVAPGKVSQDKAVTLQNRIAAAVDQCHLQPIPAGSYEILSPSRRSG
jgi:hypothetical protein